MIRDDNRMKLGLTIGDYPLAEKRPDLVVSARNKSLADLTLEAVEQGAASLEDFRITPRALRLQAEIAEAAGRPTLGRNFERAAELVDVPQETILQIYELLRPGRAKSKIELLDAARLLREQYGAGTMAGFVEQAAEVYERRGLFTYRF
ncbi:diol dehydratase small subunit [Dongia soli]|uniref:Diol dehydratase small subunit n=1 Tax=Dongia soli TaxID=600628 RepID=A0ABU5EGS7_9PROT|nr:diol dehydratase small subunit [Dongia soli]MDY0885477.1 diol dehydratase small subunit [Dongia soli]